MRHVVFRFVVSAERLAMSHILYDTDNLAPCRLTLKRNARPYLFAERALIRKVSVWQNSH